jgi:Fe2+ transport system protein FeoA
MVMRKIPTAEVRLNELHPKTCAVVRHIESQSDDIERLKTLGICIGRRVEVVKAGDPLIVRVFSSRIGLSAELASNVWLEICSPPERCVLQELPCA